MNQQGTVLLFTVLIVGLSMAAALFTLSRAGLESFIGSEQQAVAWETRADMLGCVDELLVQLAGDPSYAPAIIDTVDTQCSLSISTPSEGVRHTDISWAQGSITRAAHVEITIDPVTVTRFIEQ